jgi:hypothetical protein
MQSKKETSPSQSPALDWLCLKFVVVGRVANSRHLADAGATR